MNEVLSYSSSRPSCQKGHIEWKRFLTPKLRYFWLLKPFHVQRNSVIYMCVLTSVCLWMDEGCHHVIHCFGTVINLCSCTTVHSDLNKELDWVELNWRCIPKSLFIGRQLPDLVFSSVAPLSGRATAIRISLFLCFIVNQSCQCACHSIPCKKLRKNGLH